MDSEVKRGPGRPPKAAPEGESDADKMFPVRLLKHYAPKGKYTVVGEPAPAPFPGVEFKNKLWAGTVVELPRDEAVSLIENVVREAIAVVDDQGRISRKVDGTQLTRMQERRFPLAERADAYPL